MAKGKLSLRQYLHEKRIELYEKIEENRHTQCDGLVDSMELNNQYRELNAQLDIVLDVIHLCEARKHY